jgi:ligand-binding sensor domain-containing protein
MAPRILLQGIIFISLVTSHVAECQWLRYEWNNTKGMDASMVTSGLEDENKILWFGTDKGLYSFNADSGRWSHFDETNGLAGNFVSDLFQDDKGVLWIATDNGISRYSDNLFTNFEDEKGLSSNLVRAITQSPDGTLYFGTFDSGVSSYTSSARFRNLNLPEKDSCILSLLALSDSALLVGTFPEGLILYRNDSAYTLANPAEMEGKIIYSLYRSTTGEVWVGTDRGAQIYDASENRILPGADSLRGKSVYSISQNDSGILVFGTQNKIYQFESGQWSSFAPPDLLRPTSFSALIYSSDGSLWACSLSQGLFIYNGKTWMESSKTGLSGDVYSICEDKNQNLWFGSYHELYNYDGIFWKRIAGPELISGYYWDYFRQMVFDKEGVLWCLRSSSEVYSYNGSSWQSYLAETYFGGSDINYLSSDPAGNIWVSTYGYGIYRFDGENWTNYTTADGLAENANELIGFSPDGILVSVAWNGALSYFDGSVWSNSNLVLNYGRQYSDIEVDTGNNIWLATSQGILKIMDNKVEETFFSGNSFSQIAIDNEGNIWALYRSNKLTRYDGTSWQTYSQTDGIPSGYITNLLIDRKGRTWLIADRVVYRSDRVTGIRKNKFEDTGINVKPNPFSDILYLEYFAEKPGKAMLQFVSQDGRILCQVSENIQQGQNLLQFNTNNWPEGLVICAITINGITSREKLVKISNIRSLY